MIAVALTADAVSRIYNWSRILFCLGAIAGIGYAAHREHPEGIRLTLGQMATAGILTYKLGRWTREEI